MDPCPFVRVLVGNLALRIPVASKPARTGVHPSSSPCFCEIRLKNFPVQTAMVPLVPPDSPLPEAHTLAATFHLGREDLHRLAGKSIFSGKTRLTVAIYTGRRGTTCGVSSGKLLGRVSVPLELEGSEVRACVVQNGWVAVGGKGSPSESKPSAQLHLSVRAEPDPRFVFQFDGEPECSPQVFQIQGNIRQPVFSCKFNCKSIAERNSRSRSLQPESCASSRSWLSSLGSERERPAKERKGWAITIHDLSGSPVAAASMVTPFVASPGSDRVSRTNPGAWLILRPADGTWKPWGRLEAWRERGSGDSLGYRFELITDSVGGGMGSGIQLVESTLSMSKGGKFTIDMGSNGRSTPYCSSSPCGSPCSSGDFGNSLWPFGAYRGFVMGSTVEGEGKCSKPVVQIGIQHVGCMEDAAVFVALSAAVDLSMDACRLFSQKLRKELVQQEQSSSS
ncbi:hypothetical protein EJ110_NYTH18158 [Nymphaea thermarum]|nr:hypothetical protein EJ110_NYTH18158 [Nymphaea thermarum]